MGQGRPLPSLLTLQPQDLFTLLGPSPQPTARSHFLQCPPLRTHWRRALPCPHILVHSEPPSPQGCIPGPGLWPVQSSFCQSPDWFTVRSSPWTRAPISHPLPGEPSPPPALAGPPPRTSAWPLLSPPQPLSPASSAQCQCKLSPLAFGFKVRFCALVLSAWTCSCLVHGQQQDHFFPSGEPSRGHGRTQHSKCTQTQTQESQRPGREPQAAEESAAPSRSRP